MKRFFTILLLSAAAASTAFAGGVVTNTNHSAQFIRHIARGTTLDADAAYYNPAGTAFMEDGFHFSVGNQFAFQTRTSDITYAPFAYSGGNDTKRFDGKTFSPLVPNLDLVWKYKRFAIMASVGIGGGGGSAEYANGLGAFESQFAVLPAAITGLGYNTSAYSMESSMTGYQVTYAAQLGAAIKITKWLSFAAQARFNIATNKYQGYIRNIMVNPTIPGINPNGDMVSASTLFNTIADMMPGTPAGTAAAQYAALVADKELDCMQTGWAVSPVLALYFNHKGWSAMVRYDFRSAIKLTNSTKVDGTGLFPDGARTPYDQPAMLTTALSKRFVDRVTLTAEYHYYFDKQVHWENAFSTTIPKQDLVNTGTMEYLLGVEFDVTKNVLLSCGVQYTDYDVKDEFHSELSYQLDAVSVGLGGAFRLCRFLRLNVGVMHGFFLPKSVTSEVSGVPYTTRYSRRSTVASVGLDFSFTSKKR